MDFRCHCARSTWALQKSLAAAQASRVFIYTTGYQAQGCYSGEGLLVWAGGGGEERGRGGGTDDARAGTGCAGEWYCCCEDEIDSGMYIDTVEWLGRMCRGYVC